MDEDIQPEEDIEIPDSFKEPAKGKQKKTRQAASADNLKKGREALQAKRAAAAAAKQKGYSVVKQQKKPVEQDSDDESDSDEEIIIPKPKVEDFLGGKKSKPKKEFALPAAQGISDDDFMAAFAGVQAQLQTHAKAIKKVAKRVSAPPPPASNTYIVGGGPTAPALQPPPQHPLDATEQKLKQKLHMWF